MPSKKLSKIGLTLLLAASFSMPFSFPARADFTSTDSTNLRLIQENTSNTVTRLGTIMNSYLADIKSDVAAIDTNVSNIKTAVANTITTTLNQINTKLGNISGYVDGIEGYIDGVESKLDTISGALSTSNSNWVTLGNYIDAIYNTDTANGTVLTDTYNLLNTYTNAYLREIYFAECIIKDNVSVFRYESENNPVTVGNSSVGTTTYRLVRMTPHTYSIQNNRLVSTNSDPVYVNFYGMVAMKISELYTIMRGQANLNAAQIDRVLYDTGYIGTELHLAYQLLDAFKSANHTDITDFAAANHTDILAFKSANHSDLTDFMSLFKQFGLRFMLFWDNMTVYRVSDTQDSISSSFADLTGSYTLKSFTEYSASFTAQTGMFTFGSETKYGNTLAILCSYPRSMVTHFRQYLAYLNDNVPANTITNSVAALDQNLTNYSAAEQQIQNRVQNALSTFVPDLNLFSGFVAIAWCSQYLQKVYVALGSYGTVIMIGLLLGVCMQFIGYFRYKY